MTERTAANRLSAARVDSSIIASFDGTGLCPFLTCVRSDGPVTGTREGGRALRRWQCSAHMVRKKRPHERNLMGTTTNGQRGDCGMCVTAADIGIPEYGLMIAYTHPGCRDQGSCAEFVPGRPVDGGGGPMCLRCKAYEDEHLWAESKQ